MSALEEQRKQLLLLLSLPNMPESIFNHISQSYLFMNLKELK